MGSGGGFGADVGGLAGGFVGCFGAAVGGAGALVGLLFLGALVLGGRVAGALVAALAGGGAGFSDSESCLGADLGALTALGALAGAGALLGGEECRSSSSARPIAETAGTISTLCRTSPPASTRAPSLRMPPVTPDIGNLRVGHPLVIVYQANGLDETRVMQAERQAAGLSAITLGRPSKIGRNEAPSSSVAHTDPSVSPAT